MRQRLFVFLLALAGIGPLAAPAAAQGEVTRLFAEDRMLDVTISGPIGEIVRSAKRSTDPVAATITAGGETHAVQLSARGISRRKGGLCQFPPLLIRFEGKAAAESLFARQGRLKIVTHCGSNANFDRLLLREFAAYRLYNAITPESLRVRLLKVRYMDGGKEAGQRLAFFIEDIDDAARRLGGREVDVTTVPDVALNGEDAARYVLFQYMIANLDWDMTHGPAGSECCHNSKLIGTDKDARTALMPVPYDFDFSGLVDAPYAGVPEGIPIASVRQRHYRGLCRHNADVRAAAAGFLAARPQIEGAVNAIEQMAPRDKDAMIKFLAGFFEDIGTTEMLDRKILRSCRS